jgi:MFS superfamily sulfate permease-like transporter
VRLVVCDLSNSPYVDLTGARMLAKLSEDLAERAAALRLAEIRAETRDLLRAEELEAKVGRIDRFTSVADVVQRFEVSLLPTKTGNRGRYQTT